MSGTLVFTESASIQSDLSSWSQDGRQNEFGFTSVRDGDQEMKDFVPPDEAPSIPEEKETEVELFTAKCIICKRQIGLETMEKHSKLCGMPSSPPSAQTIEYSPYARQKEGWYLGKIVDTILERREQKKENGEWYLGQLIEENLKQRAAYEKIIARQEAEEQAQIARQEYAWSHPPPLRPDFHPPPPPRLRLYFHSPSPPSSLSRPRTTSAPTASTQQTPPSRHSSQSLGFSSSLSRSSSPDDLCDPFFSSRSSSPDNLCDPFFSSRSSSPDDLCDPFFSSRSSSPDDETRLGESPSSSPPSPSPSHSPSPSSLVHSAMDEAMDSDL